MLQPLCSRTCLHLLQERRRSRKAATADILVAGFCLPKGLSPVLPIYLHAILTGAPRNHACCEVRTRIMLLTRARVRHLQAALRRFGRRPRMQSASSFL